MIHQWDSFLVPCCYPEVVCGFHLRSAIENLASAAILKPQYCRFQLIDNQMHRLIKPDPGSSPLHYSVAFWAFVSEIDIASTPSNAIEEPMMDGQFL